MKKFARSFTPAFVAVVAILFAFSIVSSARKAESNFPDIKIKNFGQMDERFYRGARPKPEDFKALAAQWNESLAGRQSTGPRSLCASPEAPAALAGCGVADLLLQVKVDAGLPEAEAPGAFMQLIATACSSTQRQVCSISSSRLRNR